MKSIIKKLVVVGAFGVGISMMGGEQAEAATTQSDIVVSVTVNSNCNVQANPLGFAPYDPGTGAASTGSTTLQVDCTNNVNYTLGLNGGLAAGATAFGSRALQQGTSRLGYELYLGATAIPTTGTFTAGTGDGYVGSFGGATDQVVTINGTIPGSQSVAGGNYTDTVVATLTY
jgi:spore coat protein U-like protein